MNKKQINKIRGAAAGMVGLVAIILYSIILKGLPTYFDECKLLIVTAKIARIMASLTLLFGGFCFFLGEDSNDENANAVYGLLAISGFYEIIFAYFYLRARIVGYHHFITFSDNLGVLLSLFSIFMIIMLFSIGFQKYRRLLFENKSWRKEDDNSIIKNVSGFGIKFSVVLLAFICMVEWLNNYRFKPSGEENGFSYVDLKLPSGIKWANQNFFSKSISDLGVELRWGQTTSQPVANSELYSDEGALSYLVESDDVATELMGGDWYIPTQQDWEELMFECKARPAYYNGVYGMIFKKPFRLKRLFLPAGVLFRWSETPYWSSTVIPDSDVDDNEYDYDFGYDLENDYEYECDEGYGECTCEECNCRCRIEEDDEEEEEIEDEDFVDTNYIQAFIVSVYSAEYHPESFLQVDIASSYDECYIRPVTY